MSESGDTLIEATERAEADGYDAQHVARSDATVECLACERASPAADFEVDHVDRIEGASDAADMMLVARTTCPKCGARGVLTLGYGPNASDDDAGVLAELDVDPATDAAPTTE